MHRLCNWIFGAIPSQIGCQSVDCCKQFALKRGDGPLIEFVCIWLQKRIVASQRTSFECEREAINLVGLISGNWALFCHFGP